MLLSTPWITLTTVIFSGVPIASRDITQDVDDQPDFGSISHCVFSDLAEHTDFYQNSFSSATMERMMPANDLQPLVDTFVTTEVLNASVPFQFPLLHEHNRFRRKKLNITLVHLELNNTPEIQRLRRLHVLSSNELALGIKLQPISGVATFSVQVHNWFKTDANLTNLEIQMLFTIPESHVVSAMEVLFHHKGIKGYHQARRLLSEGKFAKDSEEYSYMAKTIPDPLNRGISTSFANLVYGFVKYLSSSEKMGLGIDITTLFPILHRLYSISLKETVWSYDTIEVDFIDENLSAKLLSLLGTENRPSIVIEVNRIGQWVRREITQAFSAPKGLDNPNTFDVEGGLFHALVQKRLQENIQRFFDEEFLPKIEPFTTDAGCHWKMKYSEDIFERPLPNAPWFITDQRRVRQEKKKKEARKHFPPLFWL